MNSLSYAVPMKMYAHNRMRVVNKVKERFPSNADLNNAVILMQGGSSTSRYDTDVEDVFRQDSFFHYMYGVREPDFSGCVNLKDGKCTLFMPRLPASYAVWSGRILSPDEFKTRYEVDRVVYADEMGEEITAMNASRILLLSGKNSDSGKCATPPSFPFLKSLEDKVEVTSLFPAIVECRVIKSEEELRLLQYINDVSSDAHFSVLSQCKVGMYEYQLESLFLHHGYFFGGCRLAAYTSICGCGPDSAVLHYGHAGAPNDRLIEEGDMLLCDMGAEYRCYASDITCSFPANGRFTEDQKSIFLAVQAMQFAVMDNMKPGVMWKDMHALAYKVGAEHLQKIGVLKSSVTMEEIEKANLMAFFMPHGLGHFMGLDVHDVGGYAPGCPPRDERAGFSSLRTARELKAGMVITVEPGLYFIESQMKIMREQHMEMINEVVLDRFASFGGVRLEDDVVVTATGCKNMTNCPRTIDDVEGVMSGRIKSRHELFKKL